MLKIPHSIIQHYESIVDDYNHLQTIVSDIVKQNILNENWLFKSRIKSNESYYYKLQTGRIKESLEDILACTIVVENVNQISIAEKGVSTFFNLKYRRPSSNDFTNNRPDWFSFDDLRLYLTLKGRDSKDNLKLRNLIFEIQIKTFLQHAWTIATHDLIYKPTDGTNWAMARVAFQIRAMLEHAEVSIEQVKHVAQSSFLAKEDKMTSDIKNVENNLALFWPNGLGNNVKRLSENILHLSRSFGCDISDVFDWIKIDTDNGRGANLVSYSPYEVALEAILEHHQTAKEDISDAIHRNKTKKIFVPNEFFDKYSSFSDFFTKVN